MNVIVLRVFPLSLTGDTAVWISEIPYNSIYTLDQLRDVFLDKNYLMSKNLNHKDKVNNFVSLPGESVNNPWDRFTAFFRSVPNHRIDDELLKEYFYQGQDDNNKSILDNIAGESNCECTYVEIALKFKKISPNNNACSSRK